MTFLRAIYKPSLASFLLVLIASTTASAEPPRGVAVVELFTSEGCSSCPPADDLLREIAAAARRDHEPIYPLAFHVDYWDDIGWKDPFGAASYSSRQRAYVKALRSGGPYTPLMIVNGREAFVGSRRGQADEAIRQALARPAQSRVSILSAAASPGGAVTVAYRLHGAGPEDEVIAALVERGIVRRIRAGENVGRTLRHEEVVRALATQSVGTGTGRFELRLPHGLDPRRASVVIFVQRPGTLEITGAARTDL